MHVCESLGSDTTRQKKDDVRLTYIPHHPEVKLCCNKEKTAHFVTPLERISLSCSLPVVSRNELLHADATDQVGLFSRLFPRKQSIALR